MVRKPSIHNRPVSPHLIIYSAQLSSLFSIWHRITGVTLFGMFISSGLFIRASLAQQNFCFTDVVFCTDFIYLPWLNNFLFSMFLLVFSYHFLNGCRHIIWDTGHLLSIKNLDISSLALVSFVATALILSLLYK
uniref:Succinate:cytochrome c oxidoreductase subunit 3 n=1 Tax=Gloiopeltis furcata TaxID=42017 RepID=A0A5A4SI51_9FLOR|nr:succinate:cytochrome c oxidoreductase subunit 3 [Gloiopeltis furcata]BBK20780.1 succinate:cytochrome c oxidoreductase subunit 3 [Gloiopeltis furcata]